MADLGAGDGNVATRSDIFRFAASSEWEMLQTSVIHVCGLLAESKL